jgi:acyl transferase domain-containing protein
VPSLNFEVPNENFSFSDSPLYVNTELRGWCRSGNLPRRAAVSSFGLSGTNAHVVIEEYARNSLTRRHQKGETRDCAASLEASIAATPLLFQENTSARDLNKLEDASCITITEDVGSEASERRLTKKAPVSDRLLYESRPGYLVMLSGRTLEQLRRQVEQLAEYCEVCADLNWGNVCYTLLIGRKHFSFRLACTVTGDESGVDLSDRLRRWLEKGVATRVYNSKVSESDIRDQEAPLQSNGERHIEECAAGNLQPTEYLQRLEGLAELYTQGYGLKYESLFAGGYSRVPLPTYPFARQRYWIQQPIQKKVTVAAPLAADHVDPALLNILDRVENGSLDIDSAIRVLQDSKIIMRFE